MKLFKTKEERTLIKNQKMLNEVNELNLKYKDELKTYCMINSYIFIFHKFSIKDGEIYVEFTDANTPKGCIKQVPYWKSFCSDYDLKHLRMEWIHFKNQMTKLGLEINFINNKQ